MTRAAFTAFLLLLAVERLFELSLSRRNAAWARARGGVEYGADHLVWMKLLHAAWFAGALLEVWLARRPFSAPLALGCGVVVLLSQSLRYWTIATLGPRWNIAVVVVPGSPAVASGPFKFLRHPNYVAVVAEGLAVPLAHSAFLTAGIFSVLNLWLLSVRIRCEERALSEHCDYERQLGSRPRFWPARSGQE